MSLQKVNQRPTKGQFISNYTYNGKCWASTYRWNDNRLEQYNSQGDRWYPGACTVQPDEVYYVDVPTHSIVEIDLTKTFGINYEARYAEVEVIRFQNKKFSGRIFDKDMNVLSNNVELNFSDIVGEGTTINLKA